MILSLTTDSTTLQSTESYCLPRLFCFFTALHAMQTRSRNDNSGCPSVRLSVKRDSALSNEPKMNIVRCP